jgi:hypothetical protein
MAEEIAQMKRINRPLTVDQLTQTHPRESRREDWRIRIEEMSNEFYKVEAKDVYGRIISKTGNDPDKLVTEVEEEIERMNR